MKNAFQHSLRLATIGIVAACIAGCGRAAPEKPLKVDYYRAHAAERAAKTAECANDPGGVGRSGNCVNAQQADAMERIGSLRKLPPLDLPLPPHSGGPHPAPTPPAGRPD